MHPTFVCMTDVVYILLIIYYYYQNYSTHVRLTSRIRYDMTVLRLKQRLYSLKSHTIGFTISKCCMTQRLYYYYTLVHRSESHIIFIIPRLIRYYYSSLTAREPNGSVYIRILQQRNEYNYSKSCFTVRVLLIVIIIFFFMYIIFRE